MAGKDDICSDIREMIRTGELRSGTKIPTHRELSRRYDVAIATVTKAINELKNAGIVECLRGVGTTVAAGNTVNSTHSNTIALFNAGNESNNTVLTYASNEIFINSPWKIVNYNACSNLDWYRTFLRECHNTPCAGMILPVVSPDIFSYDDSMLPPAQTKVVALGESLPGLDCDVVCSNPFGEGLLLADHIVAKKFRNIIYVTPSRESAVPESQMLKGLTLVLNRNKIEFGTGNIRRYEDLYSYGMNPDPIRSAQEFTMDMIAHEKMPELILAGHDWVAIGVIRALRCSGLRVPEDVSVISAEKGCGWEMNFVTSKITTFDNLYYHQARVAAQLLLERLNGNVGHPQRHQIHGMLIAGETSR